MKSKYLPELLGSLVKSQYTDSIIFAPMTEYNPLDVCPAAFKLAHEVGIPEYVGLGLTSAYPIKLWKPGKIFTFWGSI